jgi:hypothetical protein
MALAELGSDGALGPCLRGTAAHAPLADTVRELVGEAAIRPLVALLVDAGSKELHAAVAATLWNLAFRCAPVMGAGLW